LLVAYIWDAVLAVLAILIALAPFSGGLEANGQTVSLPVAVQLVLALEGGLYAAAVITVMIFLTRHNQWVRRAQMVVLLLPMLLFAASDIGEQLIRHDVTGVQVFSSLLIALLDAAVLFAMTGPRVVAWYDRPGAMPVWVRVTLGLLLLSGIAAVVVQLAV
jgi:hypothetical protein